MNGLPSLRLLPDARIPDGRTVLTSPDATGSPAGRGTRKHLPGFIPDTNAIEALNRQLRTAIKTKGHFPNEDAARKLIYLALATRSLPGQEPGTGLPRCWRSRSISATGCLTLQTDCHTLTLPEPPLQYLSRAYTENLTPSEVDTGRLRRRRDCVDSASCPDGTLESDLEAGP